MAGRRRAEGRRPTPGTFLREAVLIMGTAVVVAVAVKLAVAQAFYIPSGSMLPQLQIGDRVVVSKLAYRLHEPRRGDIVVFDNPRPGPAPPPESVVARVRREVLEALGIAAPSTEEYIKRVIALPGETVEARGGRVRVEGRAVVEPYLPPGTSTSDFGPVTVGPGQLFVMGDNRQASADSRSFGPIERDTVVGRAFVRVWPVPATSFL